MQKLVFFSGYKRANCGIKFKCHLYRKYSAFIVIPCQSKSSMTINNPIHIQLFIEVNIYISNNYI